MSAAVQVLSGAAVGHQQPWPAGPGRPENADANSIGPVGGLLLKDFHAGLAGRVGRRLDRRGADGGKTGGRTAGNLVAHQPAHVRRLIALCRTVVQSTCRLPAGLFEGGGYPNWASIQ